MRSLSLYYPKSFPSRLVFCLFLACVPPVTAVPEPTFPASLPTIGGLIDKSEAAFNRRAELLKHSTGTARVRVMRSDRKKFVAGMADQLRGLGIDPSKVGGAGGNTMVVHWYTKGDNLRYDTDIGVIKDVRSWNPKGVLRIATNGQVGIYYSPIDNRAYVNQPPKRSEDLTSYLDYFDPLFPYTGNTRPIYDGLRRRAQKETMSLEYTTLNGLPCIHVTSPPSGGGHGTYDVRDSHLWFSVEQGYAVVKVKGTVSFYRNDVLSNMVIMTYDACFEPSQEIPDVWMLKSMHQYEREYDEGDLTIDFEDVHLGVDVPDMAFNYDGLGVPTGAPIVDRREVGPASVSYYLPGVHVGLDHIDLAAGMVAPGEIKGAPCSAAGTEGNSSDSVPVIPPPPLVPAPAQPPASVFPAAYLIAAAVTALFVLGGGIVLLRGKVKSGKSGGKSRTDTNGTNLRRK